AVRRQQSAWAPSARRRAAVPRRGRVAAPLEHVRGPGHARARRRGARRGGAPPLLHRRGERVEQPSECKARRARCPGGRRHDAATRTLVGGSIGIVLGLGLGEALKRLLDFTTTVPVWSAVVATAMSIVVGLVFGIAPAARAARLDPVEALRYE